MFIAALFTIARTRKQPRCPSTEEWIKKLWYIYTMEYYFIFKPYNIVLVLPNIEMTRTNNFTICMEIQKNLE